MSRWSRREFLRNAAVLGASTALLSRLERSANAVTSPRPRMLVQFHLGGGIDAILTTNPKIKSEVGPTIDVPYAEGAIKTYGSTRVGPLFDVLGPYVPKMAIVNGVIGATVAHKTGNIQTLHMRRVCPSNGVGLVGTIGALRGLDAPLDDIRFIGGGVMSPPTEILSTGRSLRVQSTQVDPAHGLLDRLADLAKSDERRPIVLRALADELRHCGADNSCMPMEAAHALLEKMPHEALPPLTKILDDSTLEPLNRSFYARIARQLEGVVRDLLHVLTHRLAPATFVSIGHFDTHSANLVGQTERMKVFAPIFRYFLDELHRRRTADGVLLADQVGIIMCSELERFPVLNQFDGKDHLPEFPVILMGPGIRPGQYGETDHNMVGTPISLSSGHASSRPSDSVPTLDDIGTTALHWFGIEDARSLGYLGRRLDFLLG